MSGQKTKYIDPVNVDPDGIAEAQAVAGAGALTLDGALVSGGVYAGDYARRIGILSAGNDIGITFTVVGTDADGKAISEVVTGANAGTAETVLYFKTVTSVTASGAAAGNVSVGTVDEFVSNTIPLDKYNTDPATLSIEDLTGTITWSIDETFSDIQNASVFEWYEANELEFRDETVASAGDISNHASGIRLRVSSYTNGADLKIVINQNRPR